MRQQKPQTKSISRRASLIFAALFMLPLVLLANSTAANVSTSYVTPFPVGGKYKVLVIGDTFADGAWYGLARSIRSTSKTKNIRLYKDVSSRAYLLGTGRRDWVKKLDTVLNNQIFDIAVVMIGYGDRRNIRVDGKRVGMDEEAWASNYAKRIRAALNKLQRRKIAVYWVGLPIVRQEKLRNQLDRINSLIKIQTSSAQVRFIDNWLHFADENGLYNSYGPDVNGKIRLLRHRNGVFFTKAGYEKLGYYIYKYIQRDLNDARAERNIALLGDKRDQDYLLTRFAYENPRNRRLNAMKSEIEQKRQASKFKQFMGLSNERNKYETAKHSSITLSADKSQTGKEVKLEIIRPAIPAVAFTIARRNATYAAADREFEGAALMQEKDQNTISLSIASAIQQYSAGNSENRVPLTQTQYYKLVVRGDAQLSKPGRADHFTIKPEPPKSADELKKEE